jgi:hypothetical protein
VSGGEGGKRGNETLWLINDRYGLDLDQHIFQEEPLLDRRSRRVWRLEVFAVYGIKGFIERTLPALTGTAMIGEEGAHFHNIAESASQQSQGRRHVVDGLPTLPYHICPARRAAR